MKGSSLLCLLTTIVVTSFALPKQTPPPFKYELEGDGTRIVGGEEVVKNSLPFQLSLQTNSHRCGASILNQNYAITAAHCAIIAAAKDFKLVAGKHLLNVHEPSQQISGVSKVIIHPGYNLEKFVNDIALMKLSKPFDFNDQVQPINIPPSTYNTTGDVTVSGWGALYQGGSSPDALMKVTVPLVPDDKCRDAYGSDNIVDTMLCAGQEGMDSCQGDSGGPLTVTGEDGSPLLVGIVSWGSGCAQKQYPGVYTEVAKFNYWITQNAI